MIDQDLQFDLQDMPETIPVFPLPRALLLPRGHLPLNIFEDRYLAMVRNAWQGNGLIGMIQPRDDTDRADKPALYDIGCVGKITEYKETDDGRILIVLTGICRFTIVKEMDVVTTWRQVVPDFTPWAEDLAGLDDQGVDMPRFLAVLRRFFDLNQINADWEAMDVTPVENLLTGLAMMSPFGSPENQAMLEAPSLAERAKVMTSLIEMALAEHQLVATNDNDTDDNDRPVLH